MSELGRKLRTIRRHHRHSPRHAERLTIALAKKYGDAARRWLGRLEREEHAIPHRLLQALEKVHSVRMIDAAKVYFLRSHDGYHCDWCDLDPERQWLTFVPSALAKASQRRWRYREEIEVVGVVTRVLTRLRLSKELKFEQINRDQRSDST